MVAIGFVHHIIQTLQLETIHCLKPHSNLEAKSWPGTKRPFLHTEDKLVQQALWD